jgi:hypothetical protein
MSFPAAFSAMFQVTAMLLKFVAGGLAVVFIAITCMMAAELYFDRAELIRAYGSRHLASRARHR